MIAESRCDASCESCHWLSELKTRVEGPQRSHDRSMMKPCECADADQHTEQDEDDKQNV